MGIFKKRIVQKNLPVLDSPSTSNQIVSDEAVDNREILTGDNTDILKTPNLPLNEESMQNSTNSQDSRQKGINFIILMATIIHYFVLWFKL